MIDRAPLARLWGVGLRYLYLFRHKLDRQLDAFYWPAIELVVWGLTSAYLGGQRRAFDPAVTMVITGVMLWILLWRTQNEIVTCMLEDLWNRSSVHMFGSPLRYHEWIVAVILISSLKGLVSFLVAATIGMLMYGINLYSHIGNLLPLLVLLLIASWSVGLLVGSLVMFFGSRVQMLGLSVAFLLVPFSAAYFPLSSLPPWAQAVAQCLPTSFVFDGARRVMNGGSIDARLLLHALGLDAIYLLASIFAVRVAFVRVLKDGLSKLY